jgi:hypothetical protein
MVAEEIEAALDPADERLVVVLPQPERSQHLIDHLDGTAPYVLALATQPDGGGSIEPLAAFTTNPAGSAIVNAVGPIRQIVENVESAQRRYLVIVAGTADKVGAPVQVQTE